MPVACQSRAPECPQAFGAQRLRGLRPSMVDNPSVTASPCHLPLHKGGFDRCGGESADVHNWFTLSGQGVVYYKKKKSQGGADYDDFDKRKF